MHRRPESVRLAYERSRERFGPDHALTLHAAAMLSYAELWMGSIEHAYELAREAYERASSTHAPDHPTTLWLGATLGFALIRTGQPAPAHELAHGTHERAAAALGADHTITLVAGSVDGLAALRVGDLGHVQTVGRATWEGLVRGHWCRSPDRARSGDHVAPGSGVGAGCPAVFRDVRVRHGRALGASLRSRPSQHGECARDRRGIGRPGPVLKAF